MAFPASPFVKRRNLPFVVDLGKKKRVYIFFYHPSRLFLKIILVSLKMDNINYLPCSTKIGYLGKGQHITFFFYLVFLEVFVGIQRVNFISCTKEEEKM